MTNWTLPSDQPLSPWDQGNDPSPFLPLGSPTHFYSQCFRVVLNAVPLKLDVETKSCDFPRSWILPVLKDHVEHTELGYFKAAMLPMADMLEARGGCV